MNRNTIAFAVQNGTITPKQADALLMCLHSSILYEKSNYLSIQDNDADTEGAIRFLLDYQNFDNFIADKIYIDGIEHINPSNESVWRIYAMTLPISFLGELAHYPEDNDTIKEEYDNREIILD